MTCLNAKMRLKVKSDTIFFPDGSGGVYFQNNQGSFRFSGKTIAKWIDRIMPALDGRQTLGDLTHGLADEYRQRIYEITEVLYQNGYIRDVSTHQSHTLSDSILDAFAYQIEYLDEKIDSGAHRFESFHNSNVLAVGSSGILASLVASLFESGLSQVHVYFTEFDDDLWVRLQAIAEHARKKDAAANISAVNLNDEGQPLDQQLIHSFDAVLYVSEKGDLVKLKQVHSACKEEHKVFMPALCLEQAGIAGPLIHPESDEQWESAWRRIHQTAVKKDNEVYCYSGIAGAILANVVTFELFKVLTGVNSSTSPHQLYLLDLETLEGEWHSFLPHPLVSGYRNPVWLSDLDVTIQDEGESAETDSLFAHFGSLTSPITGIFHDWGEGDLRQLPLAKCFIKVVDPLSRETADQLDTFICSGMTHEDARRESALLGIETYATRLASLELSSLAGDTFVGIGAGLTAAQGICRGIQKGLQQEYIRRTPGQKPHVIQVRIGQIEDAKCKYYLSALNTLYDHVVIGLGQDVWGFPVMYAGINHCWYAQVDLTITAALQRVLAIALGADERQDSISYQCMDSSAITLDEDVETTLDVPASSASCTDDLKVALQVFTQNQIQLDILDLAMEDFMKVELAGVYGVRLREEKIL